MKTTNQLSLDGIWQFRLAGKPVGDVPKGLKLTQWMSATVPGTVHGQLEKLGKLPDLNAERNELDAQWVDRQAWEFRRMFEVRASDLERERQELIFDGLDTVARIFVNGKQVGTSENMFRQVVCDVRGVVVQGRNELRIEFSSSIDYATKKAKSYRELPGGATFKWETGEERTVHRNWIRKVQCHFGWDWGLCLPTVGVWQSARLECSDAPRIASVQTRQTHHGAKGKPTKVQLDVCVRLESPVARRGTIRVECDGEVQELPLKIKPGESSADLSVEVKRPRLWWPRGQGEQPLYSLRIEWLGEDGAVGADLERRIGLRTIELMTERDPAKSKPRGESFYFRVNGRPIYAKGANWIPADQYVERATEAVYRHLLESSADANMNMIRVWGGGWYEQDIFYDICDELGLLVWQDFMMACALYPDAKEFVQELCAEARYQVRRLSDHACIALWCGDNENAGGVYDWWRRDLDKNKPVYANVMSALKAVCETEDPTRRFWLSSPSSGSLETETGNPNSADVGDMHYWGVWHGKEPFERYLDLRPRFASEFGFQSFTEPRTLRRYVGDGGLNPSSFVMEHHQRSPKGNLLITNTMARELPIFKDFDSYCWMSQVNQGLAIRTAVEHWRRIKPWCMGALFWQLNDIWPVASWSSIDYLGRWKVLHHMAQRFFAPLLASVVHEADKLEVWATSDLPEKLSLQGELELFTYSGSRVARVALSGSLAPNASRRLYGTTLQALDPSGHHPRELCAFVKLQAGDHSVTNFKELSPFKWAALEKPELTTTLKADGAGLWLVVRSKNVVPFFHAELEALEGHFEGDWAVLRPGVSQTLRWVPHTHHGGKAPRLAEAKKRLRTFSLFDMSL